ncbi:MAG: GNAT family N-acetyltransferase [Robiginitomaculum sp.]|nr:GNAT family N-acetyltransferase [Robiginitomaculum sp.]
MTKYSAKIIKPASVSKAQKECWETFRRVNPALYSPYFSLEYMQVLDRIVDDVYILCITQNNTPIAFLPFQAVRKNGGGFGSARPIGAPMTDYHGLICAAEILDDPGFDLAGLMAKSGIGVYNFSASVNLPKGKNIFARQDIDCTVMDVSEGAAAWREGRNSSYRRHLKSTRRRIRKAEELGPIRTELASKDKYVFDQLIKWKREKFIQTGKYDVLSTGWAETLLHTLWQAGPDAKLRADMHALYFGDKLVAIDLGLTDGTIFHSWMVGYDNDCQHLAPGIQLLEALIDAADTLGYSRIDLGEGIDGYKRHYASEDVSVNSGYIAAKGLVANVAKLYGRLEAGSETHLGKIGTYPGKLRRRNAQIIACEPSIGGRAKAMFAALKGAPQ